MAFIKNLNHDEIIEGYLVSSTMKKGWDRELEIWQELDRICRKHGITYWAGYGTLLGAVRHGGFIPWDTDMDFCMIRPDYDHFLQIVEDELIQGGGIFEFREGEFHSSSISHSQTTSVTKDSLEKNKVHGISIDIFALDIDADGTTEGFLAFNALNELMGTIFNFPAVVEHVQNGGKTVNDWQVIESLHAITDRNKQYEFIHVYASALFNQSSKVAWIGDSILKMHKEPFKKDWFRKTAYLPFENIQLPVPIDYDKVLTAYYGDWHTPIRNFSHTIDGTIFSADIPWREFLAQADLNLVFPKK